MMQGLLYVLVILFTSCQAFGAIDAREIYKKAHQSVVLLVPLDQEGQPIAVGSGFFIGDGRIIVTNHHVISGAVTVRVQTVTGETFEVTEAIAVDPAHDIALLTAPQTGPPLELAMRTPTIGEEIVVIGNPRGLQGTLSTGIISGVRREEDSTFYQITAPISPGSSGGPVIGEDGVVLGILTFTLKDGQNLNFSVPVEYVADMLKRPQKISLGNLARIESRGIVGSASATPPMSFTGTWTGVLYQAAGGLRPSYQFVMELRQDGPSISGYSTIAISDTGEFGILSLSGTASAQTIQFQDMSVFSQKLHVGYWCIKAGTLVYNPDTQSLSGSWTAPGCPSGTISLRKKLVP